jgi:hypothetical protein
MPGYSIYIDTDNNYVFRAGSSTLPLTEVPAEPENIFGLIRIFDDNIWKYIKRF